MMISRAFILNHKWVNFVHILHHILANKQELVIHNNKDHCNKVHNITLVTRELLPAKT